MRIHLNPIWDRISMVVKFVLKVQKPQIKAICHNWVISMSILLEGEQPFSHHQITTSHLGMARMVRLL